MDADSNNLKQKPKQMSEEDNVSSCNLLTRPRAINIPFDDRVNFFHCLLGILPYHNKDWEERKNQLRKVIENLRTNYPTRAQRKFVEAIKEVRVPNELDSKPSVENTVYRHDTTFHRLPRLPVTCPLDNCHDSLSICGVMAHYIREHNEIFGFDIRVIYSDSRCLVYFDRSSIQYEKTMCLGIIAYGGPSKTFTKPAERGICIENFALAPRYGHLKGTIPSLLLATMISKNKLKEHDGSYSFDPDLWQKERLICFWLVGNPSIGDIFCHITIFGPEKRKSRSQITLLRYLGDDQDIYNFAMDSRYCITFEEKQLSLLLGGSTEIIIEVIMREEHLYFIPNPQNSFKSSNVGRKGSLELKNC